jgi:DNA-binding NarL/FixJ family response regulator
MAARIVDQPMTRQPADSDAPTIFLVERWASFRRSLRLFLEASGHRVVGEAESVARAAEMHRLSGADVVVLEPSPEWPVLQRDLATLRHAAPAAGVVLLSSGPIPTQVLVDAMHAGVRACLTKQNGPAELRRAIAAALSMDFVFVPRRLLQESRNRREELIPRHAMDDARRLGLTRREVEILMLAAASRSNREIAQILWVADQTVKFHLANIYRKLGVTNRAEAIAIATSIGLLGWRGEAA